MSTEQTQHSFTDTSPAPGPAAGRAGPGLMFWLLPLSSAALGGLTVAGFFFVIAAAAFLSDRAGYGAALSVYGTVITLLPVCIVWAVLRWTGAKLGPDSADMTGIPTSWDKHWVGVTWWTAAMATGWIVIAVSVAGLPDLPPPGSPPRAQPCMWPLPQPPSWSSSFRSAPVPSGRNPHSLRCFSGR